MAQYNVTSPDGRKFTVTAPDGASQDEILRYAQENMPAAEKAPDTAAPAPSEPASFGSRFLEGMRDIPAGVTQFAANMIPDGMKPTLNSVNTALQAFPATSLTARILGQVPGADEANAAATAREQEYHKTAPHGTDWARIAGNAVGTAPLAMAVPAAGSMIGAVGTGAAIGAGLGATAPVPGVTEAKPYEYQSGENAVIGGVGGAAGGAVGHVLGGLIAPRIAPNVRTLSDKGVELTPGQIVGGTARTIEDGARSIPGVGYPIARAQERAIESFNRSVANEVLQPVGETVARTAPVGRQLVQSVDDIIGTKYNSALSRVSPFAPDGQFMNDVQTIARTKFLTPESQAQFINILKNDIDPRIGNQPITGKVLQEVTSVLKEHARSFGRSANRADHEVAAALKSLTGSLDDLVMRTNPTVAPDIAAANAAWARLVRMRTAAGGVGAKEGVFSGPQFAAAVRAGDNSSGHRQYAMGQALMQDTSDAASKVLPQTVADSGTATRAGIMTAGGAVGAHMIDPSLMAAYLASAGGSRAAYSEPATRAFRAMMLAKRPEMVQAIAEALRRGGGAGGAAIGGRMSPPPFPPQ